MISADLYHARYALPLLPLVYLVAADGLAGLTDGFGRTVGRWKSIIAVGICLFIFAPVYGRAVEAAEKFGLPNTRLLAREWIDHHCPPGSSLLMEGAREHRSQYLVPVYNRLDNIAEMITQIEERDPGKARYWTLKKEYLSTLKAPRFDIHFVMWHEPWPAWREVVASGVQYVVVDVERFTRGVHDDGGIVLQSRYAFYQQLLADESVQKLAAFSGGGQNWGPDLEIYGMAR
jgi:hypothetical protein